jgi:hypothetical protein
VYWASDVENVAIASLLFYNDCRYVAHHLAALHAHLKLCTIGRVAATDATPTASTPTTALPMSSPSSVAAAAAAAKAAEERRVVTSVELSLVDLVEPLRQLGDKYFINQLVRTRRPFYAASLCFSHRIHVATE